MSNLINSVHLAGFLGKDPEVKSLDSNRKVARVSIATNESRPDSRGGRTEDTQWHQLVMWNRNAEIAESQLHKGSKISVEGRLTSRTYTAKDGTKRFITEIIVNEINIPEKE